MDASPFPLIALTSSIAGLATGFVMHRSSFCVAAMFRDLFLVGDRFLLRILSLQIVISMVAFQGAHTLGLLKYYPFPLLGPGSLASIIGGLLFGIGMVLAGGCVVGTLYKMGSGSVVSLCAFFGIVAGATLYGDIHPWWSAFAGATTFSSAVTLPQWLGVTPAVLLLPLIAGGSFYLYRRQQRSLLTRRGYAAGHLDPWKAALILAAAGLLSWLVIGMPLGITTSYSKLGAMAESLLWPGHMKGLAYFHTEGLNYTPPLAERSVHGGTGPHLDAIAAIQFPLIAGITLGAAISARLINEWRLYWRIPPRHYLSALLGGLMVGAASRMVPGCSLWHLWGGLPILAMQSLLFLLGLLPGTWLGSRLLTRYVIRQERSWIR